MVQVLKVYRTPGFTACFKDVIHVWSVSNVVEMSKNFMTGPKTNSHLHLNALIQ